MSRERSRGTKILFRVVSWMGAGLLLFGTIGSAWSLVTFVQVRSGWELSRFERCCVDLGTASLGAMLGSMFFVLVGSAVILLLHPIQVHLAKQKGKRTGRWLRWMAATLVVYAVGVFVLATVLAGMGDELQGFAAGIVSYCMLVGIGMLAAAWGFKRASELP